MPRALLEEERSILDFLLSKEFAGRDELRQQLEHVLVTGPSCNCGCESVGLAVDRVVPPAPVVDQVPTEAFGRDAQGAEVGVLLFVVDGYMDDLEFHSADDVDHFGRPTRASLWLPEWSEPDARGSRRLLNPRPAP
jgi:hypothetical protein